jgi:hypothetical protein
MLGDCLVTLPDILLCIVTPHGFYRIGGRDCNTSRMLLLFEEQQRLCIVSVTAKLRSASIPAPGPDNAWAQGRSSLI